MFRNLKISTGITFIVILFTLILTVAMTLSLFGARTTKNNFEISDETADNLIMLQSAVHNLWRGLAQTDGIMLAKLLNRPFDEQDQAVAKEDYTNARAQMAEFMSTPFATNEESQKANDVNKLFHTLLELAEDKQKFILNPQDFPDRIDEEAKLAHELRVSIDTYRSVSERLNKEYAAQATGTYQVEVVIAIISIILAVVALFGSRIWMKYTLFRRLNFAADIMQSISEGDLSKPVVTGSQNEIGLLLTELEHMRVALTDTVQGIRTGVKRIYSNAQEIASGNNDLSSRTEEQASALQQTAASMEELKITVRQNTDNAHTARQLADSASTSAHRGGEVMVQLDDIMRQIMASSRQIADINSVIDSIANQTNILALNAAVEAARAGEQGRGFAVVAGEVRNLAKRSADAAKESRELINTCVANMTTGSQQVEKAGSSMQEIVQSVNQVAGIMAEITSASEEQSMGINQIAQAVNEMDLVTQQNAAMVEQSAAAAGNMEHETGQLEKQVAQFKITESISGLAVQSAVFKNKSLKSPVLSKTETKNSPADVDNEWESF